MNWYLKAFGQYVDFGGRARRREYWKFVAFNFLFSLVAMGLDYWLGFRVKGSPYGVLYLLYSLSVLLPSLGVAVRRLHDVGKSGWWLLLSVIPLLLLTLIVSISKRGIYDNGENSWVILLLLLIPISVAVWLLVQFVTDSEAQSNRYGENPKADETEADAFWRVPNDTLILGLSIWLLFTRLFFELLAKWWRDDFRSDFSRFAHLSVNLVWGFIPLILAFSVKNKKWQTWLFVFAAFYLLSSTYDAFRQWILTAHLSNHLTK
jgi:uncharacterized membrane protein YhaH (DUF805 family)